MFTIDLQLAKEIIIKQNDDGTHSIQVKMDVYDEKTNKYLEATFIFKRTNIKLDKLDVECLKDNDENIWTVQF